MKPSLQNLTLPHACRNFLPASCSSAGCLRAAFPHRRSQHQVHKIPLRTQCRCRASTQANAQPSPSRMLLGIRCLPDPRKRHE
eukprot:1750279-Amphidinium_carterae.1